MNREIHPLSVLEAPTVAATAQPQKMTANISGGPKERMAQRAMASVPSIIPTQERMPPMAEQLTAVPMARPALPFLVRG